MKCMKISSSFVKTKDVVVVDHEGEDEDCNASKAWLKVKGICLYNTDRRMLSDGKWLYGTHLSAVQFLLKERFSKVNRLEDTALILTNDHRLLPGSVQVLHVNGSHWLTVSTLTLVLMSPFMTLYIYPL